MTTSAAKKTLYLRGLPAKVVRDAKVEAARRGSTLTAYVAELLERAGRGGSGAPAGDDPLAADERWYERNRERLRARHAGRYVAIVDGAVIDHDADFSALARRVFGELGSRAVFMPRVGATEEVRIRSPRLRKA